MNNVYDTFCELMRQTGVSQAMTMGDFRHAIETLGSQGIVSGDIKKNSFKVFMTRTEIIQSLSVDPFFKQLCL